MILFKAVRRGDTQTLDMFAAPTGTHEEIKVRKDAVVQTYHVKNVVAVPTPDPVPVDPLAAGLQELADAWKVRRDLDKEHDSLVINNGSKSSKAREAQARLDAQNAVIAEIEARIGYQKPTTAQGFRRMYGVPDTWSVPDTYKTKDNRPRDAYDPTGCYRLTVSYKSGGKNVATVAFKQYTTDGNPWWQVMKGQDDLPIAEAIRRVENWTRVIPATTLSGHEGGAMQAPTTGEKPMSNDPRKLDRAETYQNDPKLATLARQLAALKFATLPKGTISRGELKAEFLAGRHADEVAAALDANAAVFTQNQQDAAGIAAPAGYRIETRPDKIIVHGAFDEDLHARIKRSGGFWDGITQGNTKTWIVPIAKAASLKRVMANWAKVAEKNQEAVKAKEAEVATLRAVAPRIKPGKYGPFYVSLEGADQYRIDFEYDRDNVAAIKGVTGAKYQPASRSWLIDAAHADHLQKILTAAVAQFEAQAAAKAAKVVAVTENPVPSPVKTYLNVPFEQKDNAKRHGARWDSYQRAWYVTGNVPEALYPYWAQAPLPDGHFRIGGGDGYGWREMHPGEIIPNPNKTGPQYVKVVSADKTYYKEDGLSFGLGADSGYYYSAVVVPATPEESAPLEAKRQQEQERREAGKRVKALSDHFRDHGERPEGMHTLKGERLLDSQNLYGGGSWWVIQPDAIWYVLNNGADGDNWSVNNVQTGGAGAIGWKMPRQAEDEAILRAAEDQKQPSLMDKIRADHAAKVAAQGLSAAEVLEPLKNEEGIKAEHRGNQIHISAKSQQGDWIWGGSIDLADGFFSESGTKATRWVRSTLRDLIDRKLLSGIHLP